MTTKLNVTEKFNKSKLNLKSLNLEKKKICLKTKQSVNKNWKHLTEFTNINQLIKFIALTAIVAVVLMIVFIAYLLPPKNDKK